MHAARDYGEADALRLLLEKGADVDRRNKWTGDTPLIEAAGSGCTEAVRLLLEKGGPKPLHMALSPCIMAVTGAALVGEGCRRELHE